ncbi:MAG: hypothetical protein JSV88_11315 [Candidatus Aminicenantes bacterium]|nr:MAG: hypothetical protein JSV88_11315 [Candidatus Aminicenantes bacterium]
MNKKSLVAAAVMMLFFLVPLRGDWKNDIGKYFHKAHEYENIVKYLEANLENIPTNEKSLAIIILCYAYREMGDMVNEEKWVAELFENYKVGDPDFMFLSRNEGVKVYEYFQQWKRRYPGVKAIDINKQSERILYFNPPGKFYLDIRASAPCEITIVNLDNQREVLYSGYLTQGPNTIGFPFVDGLKKQNETLLEMVLKSGTIERKRTIVLGAAYQYPETIKFEPREGKIAVRGKEFKEETSREISRETRGYYDKKHFLEKAVPHLAAGLALYLLDALVVRNTLNRESSGPGTKALMNGIDKGATVLAIGFSLKGLIHVFRSFKKEKKETVKIITNPDAVQHNNALRREIQKAKENIFVTYRLREVKSE